MIQKAFLEYYKQLLGQSQPVTDVCNSIIRTEKQIETRHYSLLLRPVTGEEVRCTIFSTPDLKATGPDGYSSKFYKDAWSVIGEDVSTAIIDFFRTSKLLRQDLARLYNRKSVSPRCLMKIDLKKAYGSIEWRFVESIFVGLQFPWHFINLLMECVISPSYSLTINGNSFGFFNGNMLLEGYRQRRWIAAVHVYSLRDGYLWLMTQHTRECVTHVRLMQNQTLIYFLSVYIVEEYLGCELTSYVFPMIFIGDGAFIPGCIR